MGKKNEVFNTLWVAGNSVNGQRVIHMIGDEIAKKGEG